ncbi:hypothetical protein B0T18DRAFT_182003 [Schizothecium vesticola]|uniref:Uncharacterized protein n=1 Tax=Schizothecium vesticola TaxID=314040 RepID=A0AA40EPW3_9PEZI|nr:hypothetical protein B0T18DRAFT_182003 [Schizothecium vesticola]
MGRSMGSESSQEGSRAYHLTSLPLSLRREIKKLTIAPQGPTSSDKSRRPLSSRNKNRFLGVTISVSSPTESSNSIVPHPPLRRWRVEDKRLPSPARQTPARECPGWRRQGAATSKDGEKGARDVD